MFFRRSAMRQSIVSNGSRSHAKPRGLRMSRFESLENRQMFNASSIVPVELEPNSSLMVQEVRPFFQSDGYLIERGLGGQAQPNGPEPFRPPFIGGPHVTPSGSTSPGSGPFGPNGPNGPEPFRPPFIDGPHVTPSGPRSGPFGPNGPNGPEPFRRWEVGPDGELYPLGEGPGGSTPLNPPPVEPGAGKQPPAPRDPNSVPSGPGSGPFGPNGANGPEPFRRWEMGPEGELYPLGEGPEGSTPVPAPLK